MIGSAAVMSGAEMLLKPVTINSVLVGLHLPYYLQHCLPVWRLALRGKPWSSVSHHLLLLTGGAPTDKGEGQDLEMREGDDDGVLELAPHYQYISGLRYAQPHPDPH